MTLLIFILVFALVFLILTKPYVFLLCYLLIRPSLQIFDGHSIADGLPTLGLFSFVIIGGCFLLFCKKHLFFSNTIGVTSSSLFILILTAMISFGNTDSVANSFAYLLRIVAWICIYFMAFNYTETMKEFKQILFFIAISSIPLIAFGLWQFVSGNMSFAQGVPFVKSIFNTMNAYAIYLSLTLFCCLILTSFEQRNPLKYYYLLIFFISFSILLTFHRGSWFILALLFLIYSTMVKKNAYIYGLCIVIILSSAFLWDFIVYRIGDIFAERRYGYSSFEIRIMTWTSVLNLIKENVLTVLIPGQGIGSAQGEKFSIGIIPHNDYLRLLFEIGLLGTVSYILFFIVHLKIYIKEYFKHSDKKFILPILGLLVYFIVVSFTQNNVYNVLNMGILMAVLGSSNKIMVLKLNDNNY